MSLRVTVLGCGGSGGVPLVGGIWGNCDPGNPKNRRRRVSVAVETEGRTLLIDTSPDLREQLLDAGISDIDVVLFTHAHADHAHGLDDLRSIVYRRGGPIEAWADPATRADLADRFDYAFASRRRKDALYPPLLDDQEILGPFEAAGIPVVPFVQGHGHVTTLGFRIGGFAYSTDVKSLDEAAFAALEGLDLWIVDCLRDEPHPTHSHLAQTLEWIERLRPKRAILTHMNHSVDYEDLRQRCPPCVEPAYDGMVLSLR
jgi:phosphoribosyl 1,2-cyclic phosphate phosphodiesterase